MKKLEQQYYGQKTLLIIFILFVFSLSVLYINRNESYPEYDRLHFESAGVTLYANLYYPAKELDFQQIHPLVIWAHGIGSQKDVDLRVPVEFTKRGFFVVALGYQGQGESGGNILNIDETTHIPAIAEDCSNLLNYLETTEVYRTQINPEQIGLIGHSLGGMVVLMNAALDPRFKATVTWAALVNPSPNMGLSNDPLFVKYFPVNLCNKHNTKNLLAYQHVDDPLLNFTTQALVLQKVTGCKLVEVTQQGWINPHCLYYNEVITGTINWFENIFFHSSTINGPIFISFWMNYILLTITLILLIGVVLAIIRFASNFAPFEEEDIVKVQKEKTKEKTKEEDGVDFMKSSIYFNIIKIGVSFSIFLLIFEISFLYLNVLSLVIAPLVIIVLYFFIRSVIYLNKSKKEERVSSLKNQVRFQLRVKVLSYGLFSTITLLSIYFVFSISYPFAFFFPSEVIDTIVAFSIYPLYLAMELFYRKIIYPMLSFIPTYKYKIYAITILSIVNQLFLMALVSQFFIINAILVTFLVALVVVIINGLIYERTEHFSSVILTSFLIIQVFFGAAVQQALGIESFVFNFLLHD